MKKNKRHLYKRLPKYALGTMKPVDLGYLLGNMIGSFKADTESNVSLAPETKAIRRSYIPSAVNNLASYVPYIKSNLDANKTITESITNIPNSMSQTFNSGLFTPLKNPLMNFNVGGEVPSWVPSAGVSTVTGAGLGLTSGLNTSTSLGSTGLAGLAEKDPSKFFGVATKEAGSNGFKRFMSGIGGKALGIIGATKGLIDMGGQISNFGDHRSASDMLANVGRNKITTEYGNAYDTYNSINTRDELNYENANSKAKQLNFATTAIGTGATIGSLFPGIGTLIGGGVGALLGGLGSILGWGDNSDEIERITRNVNDNIARYNKLSEALARSKDIAAEFHDRVGSAAKGKDVGGQMDTKNAVNRIMGLHGPDGYDVGRPKSLLEPGEITYDPETKQGSKVPGKGNEDTVPSYISPGDLNIVYSKKLGVAKYAEPLVKEMQRLDDIIASAGGSEQQKQLQVSQAKLKKEQLHNQLMLLNEAQNVIRELTEMNKYKNGKLPGFAPGKPGGIIDYLMAGVPHMTAALSARNLYNRAKYADLPDYPNIVDSSANTRALDILGKRRFDPSSIIEHIHRVHRNNLYDINRTAGLTAGGQTIARANNAISEAQEGAKILAQADEMNNKYVADYAGALSNYGKWLSEMMTNNNYARAAFRQQQNAAKEGWMAQYEKNGLTALSDLARDVMGVTQFGRSYDLQDRMLDLYGRLVDNDRINAKAALANAEEARLAREKAIRDAAKDTSEKAQPVFFDLWLFGPNNLNNLHRMLNYRLSPLAELRYPFLKRN